MKKTVIAACLSALLCASAPALAWADDAGAADGAPEAIALASDDEGPQQAPAVPVTEESSGQPALSGGEEGSVQADGETAAAEAEGSSAESALEDAADGADAAVEAPAPEASDPADPTDSEAPLLESAPVSFTAAVSADGQTVRLAAQGGAFSAASRVQFPTWSLANGQDDIVWYDAVRAADGSWYADVPVSAHGEAGAYTSHAYADGAVQLAADFSIAAPTGSVSVVNNGDGSFVAIVSGIESASGVSRVQIPIWSEANGQDDIIWYDAALQADGSWQVATQAGYHACSEGVYNAHAYVTCGNGVTSIVGGTQTTVALSNYLFVSGDLNSSSRTVWAKNLAGNPSRVQVPTWSEANGQDDITWHEATYLGDGLWQAVVDCYSLHSAGTVISHVYAGGLIVDGLSYTVTDWEVANISGNATLDRSLREIYTARGTDLQTLFNYVVSFPYYSGNKLATGATGWDIPYAIEMYQNGGGNCYRYAALFCWLARGLGYDANVVAGSVPSYSGWNNPHGWVEIHIDGTTYVCDPDLKHENPGYNWYMVTYDNAPTWYYR